jgi:hypothetical protein
MQRVVDKNHINYNHVHIYCHSALKFLAYCSYFLLRLFFRATTTNGTTVRWFVSVWSLFSMEVTSNLLLRTLLLAWNMEINVRQKFNSIWFWGMPLIYKHGPTKFQIILFQLSSFELSTACVFTKSGEYYVKWTGWDPLSLLTYRCQRPFLEVKATEVWNSPLTSI